MAVGTWISMNAQAGRSWNIIALNGRKYHPVFAIDNDRGAKLRPLCTATLRQLILIGRLSIKRILFCTCFQIVFPSSAPAFQIVQLSAPSLPFVASFLIHLTISLRQGPSEKYSISASQRIH